MEPALCYLHGAAGSPPKGHLDRGYPQGKLYHMDPSHHQVCQQVFPRVRGDSEMTHVELTAGNTLHEEEGRNITTN